MKKNAMSPLYDKIKALGFRPKDINALLPDWWNDEIASSASGFKEAALMLSRIFNVQYKSLLDPTSAKAVYQLPEPNFKITKTVDDLQKLNNAVSMSISAAKATFKSFDKPLNLEKVTAETIRKTILERGNRWVDIRALTDYCWEIGIPVLFLNMPTGITKMQGLAISVNHRPVIILTSKKDGGYLVFDLAHELGHILANHLEDGSYVADEKINPSMEQIEIKEMEANNIALEILTGRKDTRLSVPSLLKHSEIATACIKYGKDHYIDPLHILLNVVYHFHQNNPEKNAWAHASTIVKSIKAQLRIKSYDFDICREIMIERLDFSEMKDLEQLMIKLTSEK